MLLSQIVRQAIEEYKATVASINSKTLPIPTSMSVYIDEHDNNITVLDLIEELDDNILPIELVAIKKRVSTDLAILQKGIEDILQERNTFNGLLHKEKQAAEQKLFDTIKIPELKINNALCFNRNHLVPELTESIQDICANMNLPVIINNRGFYVYYNNIDINFKTLVDKIMLKINAKYDSKYSELWKYIQNTHVSFDPRYSNELVNFLEKIGK